jgi:FixJ family two-component response regulator
MEEKTIYILEDERIIAMDYIRLLQKNGFKNISFYMEGEELFKAALLDMPDLVIADILLKDQKDGSFYAKKLILNYNIPVLFISGVITFERQDLYKTSNSLFLSKPIRESEFLDSVKKLLSLQGINK